jgi:hypothetical protein
MAMMSSVVLLGPSFDEPPAGTTLRHLAALPWPREDQGGIDQLLAWCQQHLGRGGIEWSHWMGWDLAAGTSKVMLRTRTQEQHMLAMLTWG